MAALKKAREQSTKTAIENSSLRANQVRAKEQFNNHVKRLETDVNFEREQVKLVKTKREYLAKFYPSFLWDLLDFWSNRITLRQ